MASKDESPPETDQPDPPEKSSEPEAINEEPPPPEPEEPAPAAEASAPLRGASAPQILRAPEGPRGAAWAEPIARFERGWTWLETRLLTFVLIAQILALVAWVFLTGLSTGPGSDNAAGVVFRGLFGAAAAGTAAWVGLRRQPLSTRRGVTLLAFVAGAAAAPLWQSVGVEYFDNIKAWLQEGSTLTLMGGLRGLATRLTLWLALLGGSLATSAGKHIHVDLLFRALPKRLRLPAAITNYLAAALVCFAAVWGFLDHIAIESFGARADERAGAKVERVAEHVGQHVFLARKQAALDLRSLPRVVAGRRYDQWLGAAEWNAWLREAGYEERFPGADLKGFVVPEDAGPHIPLVVSPDGESTRGILVHSLSLVFPFGLLMIGLRFLLRALLSVSGHIPVDPNEAHKEELHRAEVSVLDPAVARDVSAADVKGGA